jgi:hypothetical protein
VTRDWCWCTRRNANGASQRWRFDAGSVLAYSVELRRANASAAVSFRVELEAAFYDVTTVDMTPAELRAFVAFIGDHAWDEALRSLIPERVVS